MDAYKKVLQALVLCSAPRNVETMDDSTVFRTAFLVEEVKVRSERQKPAQICAFSVSDGLAQYELPVWPELYEEKKNLILENHFFMPSWWWRRRNTKRAFAAAGWMT